MKPYWLPLLILGTHLSLFTPNALAFDAETVAKPLANVETSEDSLDKWEDARQGELDADVSLEKGFHRRRRRRNGVRYRNRRRLRHRTDRPQVIIIRRGGGHDVFRRGELRRDDIFFRNDPFRSDRFHRGSFRRDRIRRDRVYDDRFDRFDRDGFQLIIRGD